MASCKTEWTSCMHGVRSVITASFTGYAMEDPVITASLPRYRGRYATVTEGMPEIPPEIRGHRWRVKGLQLHHLLLEILLVAEGVISHA